MVHVCDLLLVVQESLHDRFYIVCWAFLVDFSPLYEEMRRHHVNCEGEVRCVLYNRGKVGVEVELVDITNNNCAVMRT